MFDSIALNIFVFALLGGAGYILDRKIGVSIYRWSKNWTTRNGLPKNSQTGFVYGRNTAIKMTAALVGTILALVAICKYGNSSFITEIALSPFRFFALLLGFLIGPWLYGLWAGKEKWTKVVDQIDAGEINVTDEMGKIAGNVAAEAQRETREVKGVLSELWQKVKSMRKKRPNQVAKAQEAPRVETPEEKKKRLEEAQAAIDRYTNRR